MDSQVKGVTLSEWTKSSGELEWVWEDAILRKHITLLQAAQKVGKSTLIRNLIRCVTTGEDFLGRAVTKGKVIYLPLEGHPSSIREHCDALGLSDNPDMIVPLLQKKVITCVKQLEDVVRLHKPVLVVIDPIIKFVPGVMLSNYDKVYKMMQPFIDLASDYDCAIVFIHHERKAAGKNVGQRGIGSTALPAVVSTTISMTNTGGIRTLDSEGWNGTSFDGLIVERDEKGIMSLGASLAERYVAKYLEEIRTAFEQFDTNPTIDELLKAVEGDVKQIKVAFHKMVSSGLIEHCEGQGVRGNPKRYRMPEGEENDDESVAFIPPLLPSIACTPLPISDAEESSSPVDTEDANATDGDLLDDCESLPQTEPDEFRASIDDDSDTGLLPSAHRDLMALKSAIPHATSGRSGNMRQGRQTTLLDVMDAAM